MQSRIVRAAVAALCLSVSAAAVAADLIPVEDFTRRAMFSDPALSPDGKYIALAMHDESGDQHALVIYHIDDMTNPASILRMPRYMLPEDITWVSNTRLVLSQAKEMGSIDKPYLTGEIIATDVDGKHQDYLFGWDIANHSSTRGTDRGWGFIEGRPRQANNRFYMRAHMYQRDEASTLYDVDSSNGARRTMADIGVGGMAFTLDDAGQVRYAFGGDENFESVVFRQDGNGWTKLDHKVVGVLYEPLTMSADGKDLIALHSAKGGPTQLVRQDGDGQAKVLASDPFSSVGDVMWTPKPYQPIGAWTLTGIPKMIYVDPANPYAKLHQALAAKFPGKMLQFVNFSDDGKQLLFSTSSDRDLGSYFLIELTTYKVRRLFDVAPWIDPAKMAERRPIRFKARDGEELEGYLTLPPGRNESKLPMVLMPHGGPDDIRDDWGFDSEAQFLANRGYLVLQVNFRGSSGRGRQFVYDGYRQWGGKMQQDLIDGVKWAIGENYADPARVCVFGASFGGYSALMAPIRAPGMFKCAVGYAGVYDMHMRYEKGDSHGSKRDLSYLETTMGKDPAELAANSPVTLVSQLDVPVLLIHGEDDERAPYAGAKEMRAALDAAHKPYEWMSVPGEGHGFYKPANNVAMFNRLQAFLEKYIGAGAPAK
ncbi:alpha/beta hydrolase family protein [Pinirhizobacter soli]|uniref:alpha/beta hydrolase family protein n=1 Tax=Pinirhizobacter soli TaxID=2786953 RepID=UPI002029E619|nr:prolyl oligopeptidase family serine peptidase [Pinirhizobacter soli]